MPCSHDLAMHIAPCRVAKAPGRLPCPNQMSDPLALPVSVLGPWSGGSRHPDHRKCSRLSPPPRYIGMLLPFRFLDYSSPSRNSFLLPTVITIHVNDTMLFRVSPALPVSRPETMTSSHDHSTPTLRNPSPAAQAKRPCQSRSLLSHCTRHT